MTLTRQEIGRRYRQRHPQRARATQMNWKRRSKYGVHPDRYQEMFEAQRGLCAVCGQPETRLRTDGAVRALVIDHDHQTGAVRALLCSRCNSALSTVEDQELHRALLAYLAMWKRTA